MAQRQIQSSFTFGELDPLLFARSDFTGFYKGAAKARNVVVPPQGALTKRFGSALKQVMRDVTADADITDLAEVRLFAFFRANAGAYFIVFRKNNTTETAFSVYDSTATLQATVSGSTTWTVAQLADATFTATQDRILIWHKSVQTRQLFNADSTDATDWVLSAVTFTHRPTYDFSLIDGTSYTGSTVTFTPSATTGAITLTCANATPFHSNHVGGIYIGGGGSMRITAVASTTVCSGYSVTDFSAAAAIRGDLSVLKELAWSDANAAAPAAVARGWPSLAKVIQDRLVAANTGVITNLSWLSKLSLYINYDDSEADADSAFSLGLPGSDEVVGLEDKNALIVIGARGVYSTSQLIAEPLTISNTFLIKEDSKGGLFLPVHILDDQIFFVDKQGQQINLMADKSGALGGTNYEVANATTFSPTLINNPTSIGKFTSATDKGKLLLVSNTDGTMAVLLSEQRQDVAAWTLAETRGTYNEIADINSQTMVLVSREVNSGATIAGDAEYAFKVNNDFDVFTDITTSIASASSDVTLFEDEGDYLLLGHASPFDGIAVALDTNASADIVATYEYLDNNQQWISFSVTDGTSGFTGNGNITWVAETTTSDWVPNTINDVRDKFWLRIKRTVSSLTTSPIEDTININVATKIFLEELSFSETMDCTITTTSDANGLVTGLDNLIGQSVFVNADGAVDGPFIVDGSGEITIDEVSASDVEVGIFFSPRIVPMPVAVLDPTNPNTADLYKPRLIKTFFVDYYESLGLYVQGVPTKDIDLGVFVVGQVVQPVTRVHEVSPRTGWEPRVEIEIIQKAPLPFTVRGVGYVVEVS